VDLARQAVAFPVDRTHLITAADAMGGRSRVKLENTQGDLLDAKWIASEGGLALLELKTPVPANAELSYLNLAAEFIAGPAKCVAIPEESIFAPSPLLLKADTLATPPAQGVWNVGLNRHPRLAGAPLINQKNEVIGVVLARRNDPRAKLPAIPLATLRQFLAAHHVLPEVSNEQSDPLMVFQLQAEGD
jgi:hypothetical protein